MHPPAQPSPVSFAERLAARVRERESQIVLGLDPDPVRLWPQALAAAGARELGGRDDGDQAAERAAAAVAAHCELLISAAGPACVAVKAQVACFERLGAPGWRALQTVARAARADGLLVIADAKRGDVDVSAAAYAQAFLGSTPTPFGEVPGLGADALTVNPLLGTDALAPLVSAARQASAGLFVLVRTSNAGAADVQEAPLAQGGTVAERLARIVAALDDASPHASGLGDVGAVVGATAPGVLERLRELMPRAIFLLPGVGAQGGRVGDLAPAFSPGRSAGLISASRSIVHAHEREGGDPASAARAEAERLRAAAWSLGAGTLTPGRDCGVGV